MREKVIKAIEKEKIVVIVRGVESDKLIPLAKAMYDGGIRLLEITYSANGSVSDEDTAKNIEMLAKKCLRKIKICSENVLYFMQQYLPKQLTEILTQPQSTL